MCLQKHCSGCIYNAYIISHCYFHLKMDSICYSMSLPTWGILAEKKLPSLWGRCWGSAKEKVISEERKKKKDVEVKILQVKNAATLWILCACIWVKTVFYLGFLSLLKNKPSLYFNLSILCERVKVYYGILGITLFFVSVLAATW